MCSIDRRSLTAFVRVLLLGNIIISPGGTPKLPPALAAVAPHPRVIHSAYYLSAVDKFFASIPQNGEPLRIAVIGAGQSSTEVLLDLHSRLNSLSVTGGRKHQLDMIFRRGSLKPSDDTPFSNEIFDPASELPHRINVEP